MEVYAVSFIGLLCLLTVRSRDVCDKFDVNGCSTPSQMNFFYKRQFTPACNRHDMCYRCASQYGINKTRCDDSFYGQMKDTCLRNSLSRMVRCRVFAKVYYQLVKWFGHDSFKNTASWFCHQPWVMNCIPQT